MIKDIIEKNESVTANDKEMAVLKENFSSCFDKDGKFDIVKFQEIIKDKVDVTKEGYELNFLGKSYAKLLASIDTTTVIKPDIEHNSKPENAKSENIYISGDNLDALKHLSKSYAGQVKCIYIDPPYNTGSDGFVYNDKFNFTVADLVQKLSISEDEATRILDLTKRGSASHSAWLAFMYPRLLLARDMLKENGVIFISIDDNEFANLKAMCDFVFGEDNFLSDIIWNSTKSVTNTALISVAHTHTLVYFRKKEYFVEHRIDFRLKEEGTGFENPDNDPRGPWKADPFQVGGWRPNQQYDIINPKTGIIYRPNSGSSWKNEYNKYLELVADNRIVFGVSGEAGPQRKRFKYEAEERGRVSTTLWTDVETTTNGTQLLKSMFGGKSVFSNPKPIGFIQKILELGTEKDCIVLDFFSGSATTAHSILEYNLENKTKIKYILVQLPENLDVSLANSTKDNEEYIRNAISICDDLYAPHLLSIIGQERIIRAAAKIKAENPSVDIDYGFKHFTLVEPSATTIDKLESFEQNSIVTDNDILKEFGKETVLATWLNDDGYGLTTAPQEIDLAGYKAYFIGKHLYFLDNDFNNEAQKALFEKYNNEPEFNPENIVLFGYSFSKWTILESLKINLRQLQNKKINFNIRY